MEPKCAVCGEEIKGKELFIRLILSTIWGGDEGAGLILCTQCASDKLGINLKVLAGA